MAKVSLNNLNNLQNEATAVAVINSNNNNIVSAMDNTLSRDGSSPNTMLADLDMNSNQILNLPDATSAQEPLTLSQFNTFLEATDSDFISASVVGAVLTGRSPSTPTYLRGMANVKAFGAFGNGVNDDTAAIQAAMDDTNYSCIYFPRGTYLVNSNGINGQSNKMFLGDGIGNSIIKMSQTIGAGKDFFFFFIKNNVVFKGLTLDGNDKLVPPAGGNFPGYRPCMYFLDGDHIYIEDCEFKGWDSMGWLANTAHTVVFRNNLVTRATASTGVGYPNGVVGMGIGGASPPGDAYDFLITGNTCVNCSITSGGHDGVISHNTVHGCDFGAGIFSQGTVNDHDIVIANNVVYDIGHSLDRDLTYPDGIQNWAKRSVISGNIVHDCWGPGISNGGQDCIITGNIAYNNGKSGDPGFAGFYAYCQDANFNASGSHWAGNKAYDNQTVKTQDYGFVEHPNFVSAGVPSKISLGANQFTGNDIGEVLLQTGMNRSSQTQVGNVNISQGGFISGDFQFLSTLSLLKDGFGLQIRPTGTTFNANHTFDINTNNGNRILTLSGGDVSFGGQFVTSGTSSVTLNIGGTTNLTVPAITGDTFTLNDATQTLNNKTLASPTITTSANLVNTGTGAFILQVRPTGTMTANRFLNLVMDGDRTLTLGGNITTTAAVSITGALTIGQATTISSYGSSLVDDADAATARGTLGLGTSATVNTGTSGATIPLLNGTNTWSAQQTFSVSSIWGADTAGIAALNIIKGGATNNGDGAGISLQNGGSTIMNMGNKSILFGGTYSNQPWINFGVSPAIIGLGNVEKFYLYSSGGLGVNTANDPGAGMIYTNSASFMNRTKTSWTNGSGASTATLTNAPAATNPTKWIPVDDNGTTRYIPAW